MFDFPPYTVVEKKRGETPLAALTRAKEHLRIPDNVPVSYAGRLDPMASGTLLVLIGEECKKQKNYTNLDKRYVIEILLGFTSDTGDVLGMVSSVNTKEHVALSKRTIIQAIKKERGTHLRPYPHFSSKTVKGKPLFLYALEKSLDTITIPKHKETIYAITFPEIETISKRILDERIRNALTVAPRDDSPSKVLGADFRQDAIRAQWHAMLQTHPEESFSVIRLTVTCGAGTYMRSLAERIGETLGTGGIALSIHRTHVGHYIQLPFGFGFWRKVYR